MAVPTTAAITSATKAAAGPIAKSIFLIDHPQSAAIPRPFRRDTNQGHSAWASCWPIKPAAITATGMVTVSSPNIVSRSNTPVATPRISHPTANDIDARTMTGTAARTSPSPHHGRSRAPPRESEAGPVPNGCGGGGAGADEGGDGYETSPVTSDRMGGEVGAGSDGTTPRMAGGIVGGRDVIEE